MNFVGGWLSERCASIDDVNADLFRRGSAFDRSTIWLYGYRDSYYSLRHSRRNFTAFRAAGGKGAFREYEPLAGLDGHQIAAIPDLWTEALEAYLADQGLPAKPPQAVAIDGSTIRWTASPTGFGESTRPSSTSAAIRKAGGPASRPPARSPP